jgi:thymidylate synthase
MNNLDKKYQQLLSDIIEFGVEKEDRTGTGTISEFGHQFRHKMSEGFPLLTTKKMHWNSIVTELLWFLRGDTNIKFLLDYDCHIWDGDAYKNFVNKVDSIWQKSAVGDLDDMIYDGLLIDGGDENGKWFARIPTKEEFIGRIKSDVEFAKQWGELGPIYGKQWRNWESVDTSQYWQEDWSSKDTDQIQNLINELKTNPDSRRLMVSAWNVGELDQMVLPPCHYGFQLYTRKTTREEKIVHPGKYRAISLMWNQRSVDTFLGLPFNIASYGLLLEIIAKEVNMIPDELIGNLGDVHLYKNHIEQAKEQISRTSFDLPTIQITERNWYQHQLVKERLGEKTLDEKLKSYRPDCFELIGYESHPKIKAPLSN